MRGTRGFPSSFPSTNRLPVHQERQATFKPITLKVGETKTLRVNLTPLFSFREEGDYKAAAVIDLPGEGQIISDGVPFSVLRGVKSGARPGRWRASSAFIPSSDFRPGPHNHALPAGGRSDENLVLANLALGEVVAYIAPDVFFDPQGNLHVMQPIAMGTYLYTRADPAEKFCTRASSRRSRPSVRDWPSWTMAMSSSWAAWRKIRTLRAKGFPIARRQPVVRSRKVRMLPMPGRLLR